jgi:hypothetical protein
VDTSRLDVESLIPFCHVEKGSDDIRMVYDGSASELNDLLWVPWFPLLTLDTLQRSIESPPTNFKRISWTPERVSQWTKVA